MAAQQHLMRFGSYRFDGASGQLWRHTQVVNLPPKAAAVLWCLVSQADQVVPKDMLLNTVWAETAVSESVLSVCIRNLRHGEAPGVRLLAVAAWTLWCLGYPVQAVRRSQEALALAQALAHSHSLAFARYFAGYLHYRCGEASAVQAQAEALLTLATTQGFPVWAGHGTYWHGWLLAMQGQGEAGLAQMHQGLAAVLAMGNTLAQPIYLVLLAEVAGDVGQVAEGLRLLDEALSVFEASGRGDLLTEVYRLQGELLLRQAVPDTTQVETRFQQALALACRQQAKSWELRAAMSLSRLWQRQGKREAAYDLLAPVYGWFTEGFDTTDLQEARTLLGALSR